ncbi:dihydrolipoamide acetyltransferase family protein [Pacificispira sp.]|uniref:dihydrolipoamide acetyltransferase family protein n=1 Tax=Pacificispira sp. TaxID=2888761 RepID=UPI003B51BB56
MGRYVVKLPDVGEGIAEAELVEWMVEVGDAVREDDVLASVMTDKATVEIPSSVAGVVTWRGGEIGDIVAIGSDLVHLDAPGFDDTGRKGAPEQGAAEPGAQPSPAPQSPTPPKEPKPAQSEAGERPDQVRLSTGRVLAAPSVRRRALEAGIDLARIAGSGPGGRVVHADIEKAAQNRRTEPGQAEERPNEEVRVIGLRRKISERMSLSWSRIPHITIVEEVDVSALERLRGDMNARRKADGIKLTVLPFLMRALVIAIGERPALNATFDDEANVVTQWGPIHIGIATQTDTGLTVPVVRHGESRSIRSLATELARVASAARDGSATREELTGSTITITSLGPLGALATTPIINHPEVAIVGVNRMSVRPYWNGNAFEPRMMMNLSSSFDHRVIDGWIAAVFVQRLKQLLETPALLFAEMEK